jgi:hypothetical protein
MPAVGEHLRRRRIREYVTIRKWIDAIGPEWPGTRKSIRFSGLRRGSNTVEQVRGLCPAR